MTVGDGWEAMPPPAGLPMSLPAPWSDLADNVPGQAVRERAALEYEHLKSRYTSVGAAWLRLMDSKTEERSWRVGATGERRVGQLLDRLSKRGFKVLHSVPVGKRGSDIDHIVIGPPGVFTLNTKWHPDARIWVGGSCVKVNGRNQPYVRNARFEAGRASAALAAHLGWQPPVAALLVFDTTGVRSFTVKDQPDGVTVLSHRRLNAWLCRQEVRLDPESVAALFRVARRSTTWA